jgi:hypothetical protein
VNQLTATYNGTSLDFDKSEERDILNRLGVKAGKQVLISYERYSGRKTKSQLGFFFSGIVDFAANNLHGGGYSKDEMYAILMDRCNKKPVINRKTGEIERLAVGLSKNDKYKTSLVIDEAIRWLASEGCNVESPEERRKRLDELEKLRIDNSEE